MFRVILTEVFLLIYFPRPTRAFIRCFLLRLRSLPRGLGTARQIQNLEHMRKFAYVLRDVQVNYSAYRDADDGRLGEADHAGHGPKIQQHPFPNRKTQQPKSSRLSFLATRRWKAGTILQSTFLPRLIVSMIPASRSMRTCLDTLGCETLNRSARSLTVLGEESNSRTMLHRVLSDSALRNGSQLPDSGVIVRRN